jgi:hypothetical protein
MLIAIGADVLPSAVAVMFTVPAATPVTRPLVLTVATASLDELHVGVRPVNTLAFESRLVAASWSSSATAIDVFAGGSITIVATAAGPTVTCIVAVAFPDSVVAVAVIVAVPGAMAVTVADVPVPEIPAIVGAFVDQLTLVVEQFV